MPSKHSSARQGGFSLVEIMVALVIGLLTTLVIMQVFSVFEGQKRSTTGSADAQTSGSVALYSIGRDMQMAGFGLLSANDSPLECDPSPTTPAGIDLSPVLITEGAGGSSDTLSIRYGNAPMGGVPTTVTGPPVGAAVPVKTNLACRANDLALVISGATCSIKTVVSLPAATTVQLDDVTGVASGNDLACIGAWNQITYSVVGGNLMVNGVATIPGVVSLQAQYGVSNDAKSNQITQWVNAVDPWAVPMGIATRNRIKAVRVAVIARNGQFEKGEVTSACSSETTAAPTGVCAWAGSDASPAPAIDLSADGNWQHYRYRVFETIIPLRNVIWAKESL